MNPRSESLFRWVRTGCYFAADLQELLFAWIPFLALVQLLAPLKGGSEWMLQTGIHNLVHSPRGILIFLALVSVHMALRDPHGEDLTDLAVAAAGFAVAVAGIGADVGAVNLQKSHDANCYCCCYCSCSTDVPMRTACHQPRFLPPHLLP